MKHIPGYHELNITMVIIAFIVGIIVGLIVYALDMNVLLLFHSLEGPEKISLLSAFIAFLALFAAIYSAYLSRKHNRLSLQPMLDYGMVFTDACERIGLFISNNGLGPALIENWELQVDGKPYRELGITRFEDLTHHLGLSETVTYGYFKPNSLLLQGESAELFALDAESYSSKRSDQIREALSRLSITIRYTSLYREKTKPMIFDGAQHFKRNFGRPI